MAVPNKWLDRRIAALGPFLTLCLTEKELHTACRKLGRDNLEFPRLGARCWVFTNDKTNDLCCLVCLSETVQLKNTPIEIAGVLVHEAVHVWQEHAAHIGESCPGTEQEAYAVQAISQELMAEYARRLVC